MSLSKCKECGAKVSTKAAACPECGSPVKKKTSRLTRLVVAFIGLAVVGSIMTPPSNDRPAAPVALTLEQKQAREAELVAELKLLPASEITENLTAYQELVGLNPDSAKYPKKVAYYQGRLARYKKIQGQFSSWSGAHHLIERHVKKNLKDPDSYEHIKTRYGDNGDHIVVVMQYRAKNGFGGFAIGTAKGRCTIDGECTMLSND